MTTTTITLEQIRSGAAEIPPDSKVRLYSREHHAWWRENGSGYTTDIREAGVYTLEEAWERTCHCGPEKKIEYEVLPPEPPPLPTIHPLRSSDEPSGRGPNGECLCDNCRHWSPISTHIRAQLDERGKALFEEMADYFGCLEVDLNIAESKLAGDWPGWEALKGFKPNPETV